MQFSLPNGNTISHPELVAALAKPGDDILKSLTGNARGHVPCVRLVTGEAGELFAALLALAAANDEKSFFSYKKAKAAKENILEELGDLEFYLEGLRSGLGLTREDVMLAATKTGWPSDLPERAGDVIDAVKQWVIYNKPLDVPAIAEALGNLDVILSEVRAAHGITLSQSLGGNVLKLGARYEKLNYSDEAAQARADKAVN